MKKIFSAIAICFAIGCHAQVPPTTHKVVLTWNAPVTATGNAWLGCTTANPCSYILSRATLTTGTLLCPAPTGSNYTPLNQSSPTSALTYTDATAAGLTVCYIVQTSQIMPGDTTPSISVASNTAGPFALPGNPTAPPLSGSETVAGSAPSAPMLTPDAQPEVAKELAPGQLVAHL